jgi:hypothetical protein
LLRAINNKDFDVDIMLARLMRWEDRPLEVPTILEEAIGCVISLTRIRRWHRPLPEQKQTVHATLPNTLNNRQLFLLSVHMSRTRVDLGRS